QRHEDDFDDRRRSESPRKDKRQGENEDRHRSESPRKEDRRKDDYEDRRPSELPRKEKRRDDDEEGRHRSESVRRENRYEDKDDRRRSESSRKEQRHEGDFDDRRRSESPRKDKRQGENEDRHRSESPRKEDRRKDDYEDRRPSESPRKEKRRDGDEEGRHRSESVRVNEKSMGKTAYHDKTESDPGAYSPSHSKSSNVRTRSLKVDTISDLEESDSDNNSTISGYRMREVNNNAFYLAPGIITFPAGALGVVMDIHENTQRFFQGRHKEDVTAICPHPSKRLVATGDIVSHNDGAYIYIWDSRNPEDTERQVRIRVGEKKLGVGISDLQFSPDGVYLLATGMDVDHTVYLYDWANGKLVTKARGNKEAGGIYSVVYDPHSNKLITGGKDGLVLTHDPKSMEVLDEVELQSGVRSIDVDSEGNVLVGLEDSVLLEITGLCDEGGKRHKRIYILRGKDLSQIHYQKYKKSKESKSDSRSYEVMRFSPDETYLAAGGHDRLVHVWKLPKKFDGEPMKRACVCAVGKAYGLI
ncbi:Echinoderm microtubule-associated protein-like 5, partial [Phlyctochytrium bullatum]